MNLNKKLKLVFLPFLLITISSVFLYTFLNWLLIIKLQLFNVNEEWINIWIPFTLPFFPVYFLLRPRLKLLVIKNKGQRDNTFPILIAWITISAATVIAQDYIEAYTGKLTKLNTIKEINRDINKQTKYYSLKEKFIDKDHVGVSNSFGTSGRYNADFNMSIYVTCPIFERERILNEDTYKVSNKPLIVINGKPMDSYFDVNQINPNDIASISVIRDTIAKKIYGIAGKNGAIIIQTKVGKQTVNYGSNKEYNLPDTIVAWLGVRFYKTISNSLSAEEKEEKYKEFATETEHKFDTMDLSSFSYLENAFHKEEFNNYSEAIDNLKKQISSNVVFNRTILLPVMEPFADRMGNKFAWIFGSIVIGSVIFFILLLFVKFDEVALRNFESGNRVINSEEEEESFIELFIPREGFYFTPILIIANIVMFVLMIFLGYGLISFKAQDLLRIGGNFRPSTIEDHQYWRLVTNIFLHGGAMHVLANMYGLFFVGIFLEPILGRLRFIAVYLLTGIIASISSVCWYNATVSVGASGAIFGLYGIFLALMLTKLFHPEFTKVFLTSTLIFIGFNLLAGLTGGVDNAAHIGGLTSGLIIGFVLSPLLKKESQDIRERNTDTDDTGLTNLHG